MKAVQLGGRGLVRGIAAVNLAHTDGTEHYPVDYRIYSEEADGKTKNDRFKEMLINARVPSFDILQK